MIIRILGEGQFRLDGDGHGEVNRLDDALQQAADAGDAEGFHVVLDALVAEIKRLGTPMPPEDLHPSDAVVPAAGTTLDEARALLHSEGLIPDQGPVER